MDLLTSSKQNMVSTAMDLLMDNTSATVAGLTFLLSNTFVRSSTT